MAPFEPIRIASAAFKTDPYPFYARLRAEAPVCRVTVSGKEEAWLVTRYDDVSALLKDPRLAKDAANALTPEQMTRLRKPPALFAPLTRNMLSVDDPDHARLKRLVQATFTPRRVAGLADRTRDTADFLIDQLERRTSFNLIADFAMPLPVTVISELLGVPSRDRNRFARWSRVLIHNTMTPLSMLLSLPGMLAFLRYLHRLIAMKREAPAEDLVSALVQAEEAGSKLDGDELMAMIAILLSAGHETTTNLIGNGMLALMQHDGERERLEAEPWLIEPAVEELLRFASPVEMSTHRYAREEIEIAGQCIPRGALVLGVIASANRDARQFDDPDRLDIGRVRNRHLTFGEGGHYCVGAGLARLEGRVAIAALVRRLPGLRLARSRKPLRWRPGLVLRGLERLPVERQESAAGQSRARLASAFRSESLPQS